MTDRWEAVIDELDDLRARLFNEELATRAVGPLKTRAEELYGHTRRQLVRTNVHPTVRVYTRNKEA
jgi:hypothetical protein